MLPMLPPSPVLTSQDPDVQLLQQKAFELHHARVEQRRCKLECLTPDGLIALGRLYLQKPNPYFADALLSEFCRRLAQPVDEPTMDALRRVNPTCFEAVFPDELTR